MLIFLNLEESFPLLSLGQAGCPMPQNIIPLLPNYPKAIAVPDSGGWLESWAVRYRSRF